MLSFKPGFSLSFFTFIKRLFSSSSLSAIRVVSSAYLRSMIFLPEILIPAQHFAWCTLHISWINRVTIYSLDVLLSQSGTSPLFHVWFFFFFSMYGSNCCFLTCIQISQDAGKVWYAHLFKNFLQFVVIHTVKGFGVVNKAEVGVFLDLSCFFYDPVDPGPSSYHGTAEHRMYSILSRKSEMSIVCLKNILIKNI